jgi:hypothetical protein
LADKGFSGIEWERRWLESYGALVATTPKNNERRAWSEAERRWAAGKRQIIEGVICQLKDQFFLECHRAKTLEGLLSRLTAKIAAYTCGQRRTFSFSSLHISRLRGGSRQDRAYGFGEFTFYALG